MYYIQDILMESVGWESLYIFQIDRNRWFGIYIFKETIKKYCVVLYYPFCNFFLFAIVGYVNL